MASAAKKAFFATGRRKTSSARVYILPLSGKVKEEVEAASADESANISEGKGLTVNGAPFAKYFRRETVRREILKPLSITDRLAKYEIRVNVSGGGVSGQAGAVRHGITRALEKVEPELRKALKAEGLLTRDPRAVERKKAGKHKARKSTQFSKR